MGVNDSNEINYISRYFAQLKDADVAELLTRTAALHFVMNFLSSFAFDMRPMMLNPAPACLPEFEQQSNNFIWCESENVKPLHSSL